MATGQFHIRHVVHLPQSGLLNIMYCSASLGLRPRSRPIWNWRLLTSSWVEVEQAEIDVVAEKRWKQ